MKDARERIVNVNDRVLFWKRDMLEIGTVSSVKKVRIHVSYYDKVDHEWRIAKPRADEVWKTGEQQGALDV